MKSKNHIVASKQFYSRVRRRDEPEIEYADGRSLRAHRDEARRRSETRGQEILIDLLTALPAFAAVDEAGAGGRGRPTSLRAYAVVLKAMINVSLERFVQRAPAYELLGNRIGTITMFRYGNDPAVLAALRLCLKVMAATVSPLATHLNIDSSGFPTLAQANYRSDDKGRNAIRPYAVYIRGHLIACAATNIIGAMMPTYSYGDNSSDHSQFIPLLHSIEDVWPSPKYVLADKAYFSDDHMLACDGIGAMLICPPKLGWRPENSRCVWLARRLFDLYQNNEGKFNDIYSWRGKIESVFSTIEQLYGKAIRARGEYGRDRGDVNVPISIEIEMLAKCAAQNIRQLVALEGILEQRVDFANHRLLHPIPKARVVSGRTLLAA